MDNQKILSLKEVAELTGYSYQTIYARKAELNAFQPFKGGHWRIPAESVANLYKKRNNLLSIALQVDNEENSCQSKNVRVQNSGTLISQRQAAKELGSLLAQRKREKRRSTMTG